METIFFHRETSVRRALILALGAYQVKDLSVEDAGRLSNKLIAMYRDDPDAGIHGAVEWTLRQWKEHEKIKVANAELKRGDDRGDRRWFINSQGQTFVVIDGPAEFQMGSPETEPERNPANELPHRIAIARRFAISNKEVTVEQFQRFVNSGNNAFTMEESLKPYTSFPDGPALGSNWYAAAAYCNWLSKQEGFPDDQWCYLPSKRGGYEEGMTIPANVVNRKGYRLITEAEWEYACRAGTVTSRYYGVSLELLEKYCGTGGGKARPCGSLLPNDLGLFDMLGNAYEWTQDHNKPDRPEDDGLLRDIAVKEETVVDKQLRLLRGGAFDTNTDFLRSAHRAGETASFPSYDGSFRVARTCD